MIGIGKHLDCPPPRKGWVNFEQPAERLGPNAVRNLDWRRRRRQVLERASRLEKERDVGGRCLLAQRTQQQPTEATVSVAPAPLAESDESLDERDPNRWIAFPLGEPSERLLEVVRQDRATSSA